MKPLVKYLNQFNSTNVRPENRTRGNKVALAKPRKVVVVVQGGVATAYSSPGVSVEIVDVDKLRMTHSTTEVEAIVNEHIKL